MSYLLRSIWTVLFVGVVTTPCNAEQPNIILIFVDDLGYGDLGCYGNRVHATPNLDRLAAEGQRWTSFYASGATCVPSRRGLMTGRHPSLMGQGKLVDSRDHLMPAILKQHGYETAMLGKWHLAGYPKDFTTSPMHPLECGFDQHLGTPGSNDVPAPQGKKQTRDVFDACDEFTFQVPLIKGREIIEFPVNQKLFTKRYTEAAVKWILAKREQPFFLYLAHNMPHAPIFASEKFEGRSRGGRYGDVIEEIDWSVGQVMKSVKEAGIAENTLIVFTSDNGPWTMFGPHGGTAGPLRGEKGTSWEGGYRVPAIFHWPGIIKPATINGLAANLDLHATFIKLATDELPNEQIKGQKGYISRDLTNTLRHADPTPRRQWLYSSGGATAFRSGPFKIHLSTKDRSSNPDSRAREPIVNHDTPLLFNLENDLSESNDLSADHPERILQLEKEMQLFLKSRSGS